MRLLTRILAYSHARTRARTRIRSRQLKKLTLSIPSSLSLSVFRSLSQPSRFCDCFNATRSLSCSLSQVRQASYCSSCCLLSLAAAAALVHSLQLKMLTIRFNSKFNKCLSYLSNTFAPSNTDYTKRAIY